MYEDKTYWRQFLDIQWIVNSDILKQEPVPQYIICVVSFEASRKKNDGDIQWQLAIKKVSFFTFIEPSGLFDYRYTETNYRIMPEKCLKIPH